MAYIGNKPANKAVVASDLDPAVITGQTALAVAPADTDEFLISDAGTLKRIDASLVGGGGITEADQWRITANITSDQSPISSNLERNDSTGYGRIGTGITESSGIFSFGSTGIYKVSYTLVCYPDVNDDIFGDIQVTINNSSYSSVAEVSLSRDGNGITTGSTFALVDVTDTSNVKVRFIVTDISSGSTVRGDSSKNKTFFEFIRLGDT